MADKSHDGRIRSVGQKRAFPTADRILIRSPDGERTVTVSESSPAGPSLDSGSESSVCGKPLSSAPKPETPVPRTRREGPDSFTIPPTEADVKQVESIYKWTGFKSPQDHAFKVWYCANRTALQMMFLEAYRAEFHVEMSHQWSKLSEEQKRPYYEAASKLNLKPKQDLNGCEHGSKTRRVDVGSGCGAGQAAASQAVRGPAEGHQTAADHQVHRPPFFLSQIVTPVHPSLYRPGMFPVLPVPPYMVDHFSVAPLYQDYLLDHRRWAELHPSRVFNRCPTPGCSVQGVRTAAPQTMQHNIHPLDLSQQVLRSSAAAPQPGPAAVHDDQGTSDEDINVIET